MALVSKTEKVIKNYTLELNEDEFITLCMVMGSVQCDGPNVNSLIVALRSANGAKYWDCSKTLIDPETCLRWNKTTSLDPFKHLKETK